MSLGNAHIGRVMVIIVGLVPQLWGSSGVIMKSRKIVSALVAFAVAGIATFGAPNTVQASRTIPVPDDAFETKLISLGYDTKCSSPTRMTTGLLTAHWVASS